LWVFPYAFTERQKSDVGTAVFHAEICSIFVQNRRGVTVVDHRMLGGLG
jgi:hypothetical protein